MSAQDYYEVTRLPGAALRRAGRPWGEGSELVSGLSDEQVRQIAADPGYRIVAAVGQGKSAGVEALAQETAPKPSRRKRPD